MLFSLLALLAVDFVRGMVGGGKVRGFYREGRLFFISSLIQAPISLP